MMTLFVFVGSGRYSVPRHISLASRIRICARFPRQARRAALASLIRFVTNSEVCHVAIGCNGVVLETGPRGTLFWPFWIYAMNRSLVGVFGIEVEKLPPIELVMLPPTPVLPSLLRLLTFGLWPADDCVCVVSRLLRQAGVAVPPRIVTPKALVAWLKSQGFTYGSFEEDSRVNPGAAPRDLG